MMMLLKMTLLLLTAYVCVTNALPAFTHSLMDMNGKYFIRFYMFYLLRLFVEPIIYEINKHNFIFINRCQSPRNNMGPTHRQAPFSSFASNFRQTPISPFASNFRNKTEQTTILAPSTHNRFWKRR